MQVITQPKVFSKKKLGLIGFLGVMILGYGVFLAYLKSPKLGLINSPKTYVTELITPTPQPAITQYPTTDGKKPQFIIISFDGSYSLPMWQATRDLAKKISTNSKPSHFSYFISGVYFTTASRSAQTYTPPKAPAGKSLIGFGDNDQDIRARFNQVNLAKQEGHEIGSHLNGHFNGKNWTRADWQQELTEFNKLIFQAKFRSDNTGLTNNEIIGIRAPNLGVNAAYYETLAKNNFKYDASGVGKANDWPKKTQLGLWQFPLAGLQIAGTKKATISMDYNFFVSQTGAKDRLRRNQPAWKTNYLQVLNSYQNYLQTNLATTRAPVIIGHHFSLWNDGLYWQALQDFASQNCQKPNVYCISFKDLFQYLENHPEINADVPPAQLRQPQP